MKEELTFEQAFKRLNEITEIIQRNECTLDESFALFEEGLKLSKFCNEKLSFFEEKFEELTKERNDEE
ncbi:MAG TPA: exodeoxyribonuclease VII small subunit [Bacteroidales bacterium]|nr:exodeoxyribonuclease VII small subunit [Erysipelotrichia bacterium]HPX46149.1 exodeoxyribonuclease VII small subunit [Bacteroidales bacterium]HQA85314.1 exodeoxyribonuclease VII small subunit [Erysipelotrichaceae bacterium]